MDECIKQLESTTFNGRRFSRQQIVLIQETTKNFSALSRRELAHTVCELLNWRTTAGKNKIQSCLAMLENLESLGILSLPKKDLSMQRGKQKKIIWTQQSDEQPELESDLNQLTPIRLQMVSDKEDVKQWNELLDRHHYLGYKRPIGPYIRYFILDKTDKRLGCLMFSYASKCLPCRDEWIGWQDKSYKKHLDLIINNNRFLIFPWIKVKNLASTVLSIASKQLSEDWQQRYGYCPVLLETFVDQSQFNATCYRAANWILLGETAKSKKKTVKSVYVYPLVKDVKTILKNGPKKMPKNNQPGLNTRPDVKDPFVQMWQQITGTLIQVANEFDSQWQKRRRVLNSLLIMLFIFRLVFSKNKQGYGITIMELWQQCEMMNIPLPQETPVAASAFCNARAKLDERIFKVLHKKILEHHNCVKTQQWKSHRIFAVDGSKINLPRQLIKQGYKTPSDNAHYPQGLLSCLYQLQSKMPIDFSLVAHADERKVALTHLTSVAENDVIVYDRGYFSYAMLYEHIARGLHPVFRIKTKASRAIDNFIASDETDKTIEITPTDSGKMAITERYPEEVCKSIPLRVVKYEFSGTNYIIGTTLLDVKKYTVTDLSDLYHSRWGIEELYKISKEFMQIEEFHGQSERCAKQEIYAHFVLIALTRIFSNHVETGFEQSTIKTNFKNCLVTVARNIESLLLQQAALVTQTISRVISSISACRQKLRPNRSYDRRSRKPIGKWKPSKPAKPAKPKGGNPSMAT